MKLTTKIVLATALIAAPLALAAPSLTQTPIDMSRGAGFRAVEHRTEARFSSTTSLASGKAKYRERTQNNVIRQRFSVEVEDATPGDSLSVMIDGVMFGTIIVNDLGVGNLQFRTAEFIDNPGDGDPIPSEFPRIDPGAQITVGGMNGTFR